MKKIATFLTSIALASAVMGNVRAADDTPKFRCKPGETYYMNVMVTGVEYWFPVYEMFKQAAHQLGCKTVYGGTPAYDVNQQLASFEQILAQKPAGIFFIP
jgi:monosaccharide ABC transporter substrate-binding protein, CUT2 family (TC 3.A.1.2.-)